LRKAVAAKRIKSLVAAPDAMEGALPPTDKIEGPTEPKIKEDRVRQSELPIQLALKKRQRKVQAKELASSNVVTGRRMSKKKARKLMNAMERDKRELERKAAAMDLA
jgi:hypothetical protein